MLTNKDFLREIAEIVPFNDIKQKGGTSLTYHTLSHEGLVKMVMVGSVWNKSGEERQRVE